jgi:hypothetical protein
VIEVSEHRREYAKFRAARDKLIYETVERNMTEKTKIGRLCVRLDKRRDGAGRGYDVLIGAGALARLGETVHRTTSPTARRILIISNRRVFDLYGAPAIKSLRASGLRVVHFLMGDGERYKTLRTAERAFAYLSANDFERGDCVVALGGGVVGDLRARGWQLERTDVGDKYVLDKLIETGAALGGEQSGHIIFPHESFVGDGLRTTIHMVRTMTDRRASLAAMVEGFVHYPQILVNVRVREKIPFETIERVETRMREVEAELGESGRLLLRYSGTEPLARVMIEGRDKREIEALANSLAEIIRSEIG